MMLKTPTCANLLKDANQTFSNTYELQTLYLLLYKVPPGNHSLAELLSVLREIEKSIGLLAFESTERLAYKSTRMLLIGLTVK